jgi:saccharopine dehydrogenase (NAD+, L-lysine forming)
LRIVDAMHIWLRAESKAFEERTPLTPTGVAALVAAGAQVTVERSKKRVIRDEEYSRAGAMLSDEGSWPTAPADAVILGLKELPEDGSKLRHRHIYFGHAYKHQKGWQELLKRFVDGDGALLDLEVLEKDGRRIAAFGYWAGYAGAAVGAMVLAHQLNGERVAPLKSYPNQRALVDALKPRFDKLATKPRAIIIGAKGRCGTGARAACSDLGIPTTDWDLEETKAGGPFSPIIEHEMFVNAVLLQSAMPPFITKQLVDTKGRSLRVVADVSCDPNSPHNPIPIYDRTTTFESPALRVAENPPLDVVAIDHLPSLLPRESSEDFAAQLLPHLVDFATRGSPVWARAEEIFKNKIKEV